MRRSVRWLLSGIYPPVLGGAVILAVGLGAWQMGTQVASEQWRVWLATNWADVSAWFVRPLSTLLAILFVLIVILATVAMVLGTIANYFLLRASRRVLYGLASTYVGGHGAPEWATLRPNVVPLPIPPTVGTLSFTLDASERAAVIAAAREMTVTRVKALMAGSAANAPCDVREDRWRRVSGPGSPDLLRLGREAGRTRGERVLRKIATDARHSTPVRPYNPLQRTRAHSRLPQRPL